METIVPENIAKILTEILLNDDKAKLLLQGYLSGKGIDGKIKITGTYIIEEAV